LHVSHVSAMTVPICVSGKPLQAGWSIWMPMPLSLT